MKQELKPASTVIVVRDKHESLEVLMLQRSSNANFLPDCWVFPGGAVDAEDLPNGNEIERACIAACREANEEAGIVLEHEKLVTFSHWTAPINFPRRFSTWFFIAALSDETPVAIDNQEIQEHQWLTPRIAIDLHYQGKLPILPPTFISLLEIQTESNITGLINRCEQQTPIKYLPKIVKQGKTTFFLYENDSGYKNADANQCDTLDRITMNNNIIRYHTN